jgi:hypothetical protein
VKTKLVIASVSAVLVVLAGVTRAADGDDISWDVTGSGGGHLEQDAYSLDNTFGQPVVATDSGGVLDLCAGFWCGAAEVERNIYLPSILRKT